ncbi:MAG: response regulator [Elusimicrobia bacterium]|nr:response regulator [Elusimicrobiota bacterium]MDA8243336.1 response regulator [Elusimicrobiota bacterium]
MKVLIVDDNEDIRGLIRAILESKGHTVAGEADDGEKAVKAFRELKPDAVLLDIIMPGKSGVDVLGELRAMDQSAKIIMVTAVEQDEVNRRLLLIGASGIIYKPFSASDFDQYFAPVRELAAPPRGGAIKRLAAGGLSKCMLKASDATASSWELCEVAVTSGGEAELAKLADLGRETASVHVNVRGGALFSAALVFRADHAGLIAHSFVKGPVYLAEEVRSLEEGLMLEMGNIIVNSLANALFNALKRSAIPSVPMLVKGGAGAVTAALVSCMEPGKPVRIISARLAMRREGRVAGTSVIGVLPEEIAAELDELGTEG